MLVFLLECCLERLHQGALRTDQAAGLPVVKPVFVPHAAAILERLAGVGGRVEEVPDSECNVLKCFNIFGGQYHSFWIFISYIGTVWRL
jgi:hypothetical protein